MVSDEPADVLDRDAPLQGHVHLAGEVPGHGVGIVEDDHLEGAVGDGRHAVCVCVCVCVCGAMEGAPPGHRGIVPVSAEDATCEGHAVWECPPCAHATTEWGKHRVLGVLHRVLDNVRPARMRTPNGLDSGCGP